MIAADFSAVPVFTTKFTSLHMLHYLGDPPIQNHGVQRFETIKTPKSLKPEAFATVIEPLSIISHYCL